MLPERIAEKISRTLATAKKLHAMGHAEDARRACQLVLQLDPQNMGALFRLGQIARSEGQSLQAAEFFSRLLGQEPGNTGYAQLLAASYREAQRADVAEKIADEALRKTPKDAALWMERGRCRLDQGQLEAAAGDFAQSLSLDGKNAFAHSLLGIVRKRMGQRAAAAESFRMASALDPNDLAALNGLGTDLLDDERFDAAAEHFRRALALQPRFAKAQKNLAYALSLAGEIEPARAAFERLFEIAPDYAEGHMDYGLFLLSIGEYAKGWKEYEQRWQFDRFDERDWSQGLPRWDGSPLQGRRLLLWGEQGIGDHILYGTMLPDAIRRAGGAVSIAVEKRLAPLFARSLAAGNVTVIERGAPAQADVQCPLGSLGHWLRQRPEDCGAGRYLKADAERSAAMRRRYAGLAGAGARIMGLSWRSVNWHIGEYKSLTLEQLLPILRRPGITWVSLQYGDVAAEIDDFARRHGISVHQDPEVDATHDLDGLAAQIAALDGVISTSNSTVHFAGALGVPCWVLLSSGRGRLWYWPRQGERTPWYGSVRLFRQTVLGDWAPVIERVNKELDGQ
ncbi:MAG TPA: tetratricopeptide repeat protein [Ferrovibrio sp.]|uniref:tetratricopeptide repeat protein n=1 Tax=Ferrovibrio sp. TaxID=1917215 RepID=UPI002ED6609C